MAELINKLQEEWRAIPEFENYEASSLGRIRSLDHLSSDGRRISGRILKPWLAAGRYHYVSLGQAKKAGVHRLVCKAFHGVPPIEMEAAHRDGNSLNNSPDNLVWATRAENEQHKREHGTYDRPRVFKQPHHKKRGPAPSRHPRADEMIAMRNLGATIKEVADAMGMSKSGAHGVLKRRV